MRHSNYTVLFDLVGVLARKRHQVGERHFATLGLNHTEARLLSLLDKNGGVATQDALSGMIYLDRSNAGRALKGLEERNYVTRRKDDEDARTRIVQITEKGRTTSVEIAKLRAEMAVNFFGELTEEQAGTIADLLKRALQLEEGE